MSLPSLEACQEYLTYNPFTGAFLWKTRTDLKPKAASWNDRNAGKQAGSMDSKGYVCLQIHKKKYRAHRIAWLMHHGQPPLMDLDHKNGVKTDNRIENLREATTAQNGHNVGIVSRNTSGVRGVFWHRGARKWQAGIHFEGQDIYLGLHDQLDGARSARHEAEEKYYGEFRRTA